MKCIFLIFEHLMSMLNMVFALSELNNACTHDVLLSEPSLCGGDLLFCVGVWW